MPPLYVDAIMTMPALTREIAYAEPFQLARRVAGQRAVTLFESAQRHEHLGRYSFVTCNPSSSLVVRDGVGFADGVRIDVEPFKFLVRDIASSCRENVAGLPPFQGGWAGYISYDYGRHLEPHAKIPAFETLVPDMVFYRFDTVVGIDHLQERAWVFSSIVKGLDDFERMLTQKPTVLGGDVRAVFEPQISRDLHEHNVTRTVDYILAGDIFQANITQDFVADVPQGFDVFQAYKQLRLKNPAPFAALLDYDDVKIVSSSPERLIRFNGDVAEARPIKGTRKRDPDLARDIALIAELTTSRKDRAENVMIVDLLRNDLSRVCKAGTVKVPVLCGLESYANVHHLVSVVQGALRDDVSSVDLVEAVFPGGSITGAPKVRAMEIIAELEQAPRGVYCGAIGYFGFNGTSDFNIAIRTLQIAGGKMHIQGGGGITARSEPAAEYDESLVKVARMREAFAP